MARIITDELWEDLIKFLRKTKRINEPEDNFQYYLANHMMNRMGVGTEGELWQVRNKYGRKEFKNFPEVLFRLW